MKLCKNLFLSMMAVAVVLLCLLALPQTAHAASTSDLTFTLNETGNGYVVSKCNTSATGDLVIPATYNGLPVTTIGWSAFDGCFSLTKITISDSVTTIGNSAFSVCTSLTSITIPDSVTSIGDYAFSGCSSLTSIIIPDSVTSIGAYAFSPCRGLTGIWVSANNSNYSSDECGVLFDKDKATLIQAPGMISGSYSIPDSVTTIGWDAFIRCTNLTSITIPDSVTTIDNSAFRGCKALTSVTLPKSLTYIGECAFYGCSRLTSITIPDSVTTIGYSAFDSCTGLTSIAIPDSVTGIGWSAFNNCNSLNKVIYCGTQEQWNAIRIGGDNAYLTSATLQFHNYENDNCTLCGQCDISVLTFTLNETGDGYIVSDCKESAIGALAIPATYNGKPVTSIGDWAFNFCTRLTSITIPDSVITIGDSAFYYCYRLTSITIPDSVTTIGNQAFRDCTSLSQILVGEGNSAYSNDARGVLFDKNKTTLLAAPGAITGSYAIPDNVTSIGYFAFCGCESLTSVTIPNSVTLIGESAFPYCYNLVSVTYCGTQEQWNAIRIDRGNAYLTSATLQFHSYENGACTECGKALVPGDIDGNDTLDYNDAVYLLLHTMFGEGAYPLNSVDADIDDNGIIDQEDAIYLLLHTMFGEQFYPLKKG